MAGFILLNVLGWGHGAEKNVVGFHFIRSLVDLAFISISALQCVHGRLRFFSRGRMLCKRAGDKAHWDARGCHPLSRGGCVILVAIFALGFIMDSLADPEPRGRALSKTNSLGRVQFAVGRSYTEIAFVVVTQCVRLLGSAGLRSHKAPRGAIVWEWDSSKRFGGHSREVRGGDTSRWAVFEAFTGLIRSHSRGFLKQKTAYIVTHVRLGLGDFLVRENCFVVILKGRHGLVWVF